MHKLIMCCTIPPRVLPYSLRRAIAPSRTCVMRYCLIKIDPSEVLVQKIEKDRRGRRVVNFDIRGDAMPTAREKLQKAALILPKRRGAEYDMLLLDRQVAKVAAD